MGLRRHRDIFGWREAYDGGRDEGEMLFEIELRRERRSNVDGGCMMGDLELLRKTRVEMFVDLKSLFGSFFILIKQMK